MLSCVSTGRDCRVIVVDLGELNVQTDEQLHSAANSGTFSHSVCRLCHLCRRFALVIDVL